MSKAKDAEKAKGPFAAAYPRLAAWAEDGWVEIGYNDMTPSFIRVGDEGGMIWEGEVRYSDIDAALRAAERAVIAWEEEHG